MTKLFLYDRVRSGKEINMAVKPVFTERRRDLLAKTIMDIVKVAIAVAFASEFFFKFAIWLKVSLLISIILLIIIGFLVCPKGGE